MWDFGSVGCLGEEGLVFVFKLWNYQRTTYFDSHVLDYKTEEKGKKTLIHTEKWHDERKPEKQNNKITLVCLFIEL